MVSFNSNKLSTIKGARSLLSIKAITACELRRRALNKIQKYSHLNVFNTICFDESLEEAQSSDVILSRSVALNEEKKPCKPLLGITISIKDNICTNKTRTTCSSRMLANFTPNYDAHSVSRLRQAGATIIGKTNLDEFAMGSSSVTSYYGPTANCWKSFSICDKEAITKPCDDNDSFWYMSGGSSSGSAVSVAIGSSFASIGTDTGGSTRQPASLVGVVGFKPSYGVISRFGLIPLVHSLDVISILARHVCDVKEVFKVIAGEDVNDMTSINSEHFINSEPSIETKQTIRIGIPKEFISKGNIDSNVAESYEMAIKLMQSIEAKKIEFVNVDLNCSLLASECYTIISSSEIASNMACYDGVKYGFSIPAESFENFDRVQFYQSNRDAAFGDEVKKRILLGNYFLLEANREKYLTHALKIRRLIDNEFKRIFEEKSIDFIMTPSTPTTSITFKDWKAKQTTNKLFHEDFFLIPSNLANVPAISIPVCSTKNNTTLPVGIHFIANRHNDIDLLYFSELFEREILNSDLSLENKREFVACS